MATPAFFHTYVKPVPVFALSTTDPPLQKVVAPPAVMLDVGSELTVIVIEVVVAHEPATGVKVYVVVDIVFGDGDQLPDIPLIEFVGNERVPPLQIGGICENVGVWTCETITAIGFDTEEHPN